MPTRTVGSVPHSSVWQSVSDKCNSRATYPLFRNSHFRHNDCMKYCEPERHVKMELDWRLFDVRITSWSWSVEGSCCPHRCRTDVIMCAVHCHCRGACLCHLHASCMIIAWHGAAWSMPEHARSTPATKSELCPEATDRVRENKMLVSH